MADTNTNSRLVKILAALVALLIIAFVIQSWFLVDMYRDRAAHEPGGSASPDSLFFDGSKSRVERWDPFQEMRKLQAHIDQLFGESFGRFDNSQQFGHLFSGDGFSPQIDLKETDSEFIAYINVPGADSQNLNVSAEDQVLTVTGSINQETEDQNSRSLRLERRSGHFSRSITLPVPVKASAMTTQYKDGVLEVHIPKQID